MPFLKKEHLAPAVFLLFSAAIIGFGLWRISSEINHPFDFLDKVFQRNRDKVSDQLKQEQQKLLALQAQDTDHDGLSDFEESYIYHTSPYLADTNGDGIADSESIRGNIDPNCPAGQICGSLSDSDAADSAVGETDITASSAGDIAAIRQNLLAAGMSADLLNKIDDATLLETYRQTAQETGIDLSLTGLGGEASGSSSLPPSLQASLQAVELQGAISDPAATAASQVTNYFQSLSADEIRQLLKSNGVSDELLSQIDDVTLEQLARQALADQVQKQLDQQSQN